MALLVILLSTWHSLRLRVAHVRAREPNLPTSITIVPSTISAVILSLLERAERRAILRELSILQYCYYRIHRLPYSSQPYDDADVSNVIGSHTCAGPLFDFNNGGSVLCAYSTPSSVLTTSNACNVPVFDCIGCDSSDIRYFDYSADYFQILCESGLIQYTYSDNTTHEYDYRLYLDKNTCAVTGGEDSSKTITSVSCKARPYEVDACIENAGSSSGVTGHCHFGTCWLYCQNNTKQLSFTQDLEGLGSRIDADSLVCESGFIQYGQYSAFHLECN